MNILMFLVVALLGSTAAQTTQDDGDKQWTQEELDAIFANATSDATAPTPVIVANHGYSSEIHHVTTTDGYVLEMHRIPGSPACPSANGKPVAFLMHGLICSSADWIVQGPGKSLAYILADAGYDVWLGNARGNTYSRTHIPKVSRKKFWNFSWHEIGYYDLPAMIDYALNETGQKQVVYIGHSQGTTSFFVMTSTRPEYNDKIKVMFALAPVAYMGHLFNPFAQLLSALNTPVQKLAGLLGVYELLPSPILIRKARALLCKNDFLARFVCQNIIFLAGGFDESQMDVHLLPMIFGHFPAPSSVRQYFHYEQEIHSHKFRQYDFGEKQNRIKYDSATPPDYNLSLISAPVHLFYGQNDWFAAVQDVTQLSRELGKPNELYPIPYPKWSHFDFIWGKDARSLVYERIINALANSYGLPYSCS